MLGKLNQINVNKCIVTSQTQLPFVYHSEKFLTWNI